ncbi:MAG TPA: ribbon-helix-helix protein, CopG family [Vicinamibacteria bacterium]|nr:ribbon-helix-helix protein, CopG family [Vicinamibacteria bacterium]
MRTTLTLDDALDRRVRRLAARRGQSYREAVNAVLREGLQVLERTPSPQPYETQAHSLGTLPGVDYDKVGQLADELDDRSRL